MALAQRILNPSVPFTGPIFGGLSDGKSVVIQGQIWAAVKSFAVNLVCQNGDIAFHFNPRFNEGRVVVCNTKQKGSWGPEERTLNMPFQPGVYFEMIIHVRSHCYQVSLNGAHFLEYRHRIPFHLVQNLQINGDLSVNCITFSGTNAPPPYTPPAYNIVTPTVAAGVFSQPFFAPPMNSRRKKKTAQGYGGVTLSNPAVPFHVAIPGNFTQSRKITIVGSVPFVANRFHVNLKNSMTGNIALHINPRFKEGAIVRNTQIHGSWGSEERHMTAMPLSAGCAFHGDPSTKEIRQLCPGQTITVCGTISPCADSFNIDLLGCNDDIVFHCNPRFNPCQPPCVVCNTKNCGCWGYEEATACVLFKPGCYVTITIKVEQTRYEVSACGQHILYYCHRLPPCTVRSVSVSGGFDVCGIQICG